MRHLNLTIPTHILQCITVLMFLLLSNMTYSNHSTERQKAPLKIHYNKQEANNSQPNEMSKGLITIKHIRLQGDTLFPQYGITNQFLYNRINQVYSHMDEKLSIADLNKVADSITLAYREKGLTFNQAYVVPQEITNSTLTIHVLKGVLAEIDVLNNDLYSKEQLTAPFSKLMGKVIYEPEIRKIISELNNKPGLKVFSFFSVGSKQGEARLNIRVMDETQHQANISIDNKGVEQTGLYRGLYNHTINNPFNLSGQLKGTLFTTSEKENYYGGLNYSVPLTPNNQIDISAFRSDFAITGQFTELGLEGDLTALSLSWSNRLTPTKLPNTRHKQGLTIAHKQSNVTSDAFPEIFDDEVIYSMMSANYQLYLLENSTSKSQHFFSITPSYSTIHQSENVNLNPNFWLIRSTYQLTSHIFNELLTLKSPVKLLINNQFTPKALPSSEQFSVTGPNSNRGYEPGIFSGDSAISLTIEQDIHLSLGLLDNYKDFFLTPFIFYDFSYGEIHHDSKLSAQFQSIGFGLKSQINSYSKASISIGKPIHYNISKQLDIDPKGSNIYAHISFSF